MRDICTLKFDRDYSGDVQLKYVWNVSCVVTNHGRDLHTTETTDNERFPAHPVHRLTLERNILEAKATRQPPAIHVTTDHMRTIENKQSFQDLGHKRGRKGLSCET